VFDEESTTFGSHWLSEPDTHFPVPLGSNANSSLKLSKADSMAIRSLHRQHPGQHLPVKTPTTTTTSPSDSRCQFVQFSPEQMGVDASVRAALVAAVDRQVITAWSAMIDNDQVAFNSHNQCF
jgi:ABC-type oligopeptide transport system substrate-binding subunit